MRFDLGEYGGDAPSIDREPGSLSWRDDPDESLSDWRITVKVMGDDADAKVYHVHKAIIAAGPRKSDYFLRQCRGGGASRLAEAARCESKLDLEATAAEAIPDFLDYVYSGELNATKENACSLFHLANYLGNPALHASAMKYLDANLSYNTAPMFLAHAHLFSLDKLVDASVTIASENIEMYTSSIAMAGDDDYNEDEYDDFSDCPELRDLYALHPTLFARIIRAWHEMSNPDVSQLSDCCRLIADYCARRADAIDNSFLQDVLSVFSPFKDSGELIKEYVDGPTAIALLEAALAHPGGEIVAEVRDACMVAVGEQWSTALVPLAQKEKLRREEAARVAAEVATRTQATSRRKGGSKRQKPTAGSSSDAALPDGEVALAPAALPLGPGLPAEMQLQLLGNMLLTQGGLEPFGS